MFFNIKKQNILIVSAILYCKIAKKKDSPKFFHNGLIFKFPNVYSFIGDIFINLMVYMQQLSLSHSCFHISSEGTNMMNFRYLIWYPPKIMVLHILTMVIILFLQKKMV